MFFSRLQSDNYSNNDLLETPMGQRILSRHFDLTRSDDQPAESNKQLLLYKSFTGIETSTGK